MVQYLLWNRTLVDNLKTWHGQVFSYQTNFLWTWSSIHQILSAAQWGTYCILSVEYQLAFNFTTRPIKRAIAFTWWQKVIKTNDLAARQWQQNHSSVRSVSVIGYWQHTKCCAILTFSFCLVSGDPMAWELLLKLWLLTETFQIQFYLSEMF